MALALPCAPETGDDGGARLQIREREAAVCWRTRSTRLPSAMLTSDEVQAPLGPSIVGLTTGLWSPGTLVAFNLQPVGIAPSARSGRCIARG